ncbi:hypothetical protein CR164_12190 [Prosthecochloris marina]|uniref:Uncharacterized protein n=1 Tax=Prosthecochloris marina TaxID=2017681 RepID=A0A317T2Q1_9CHLB|nr:hypothetical protein CR164_12190 [Prosthecochloris marina]
MVTGSIQIKTTAKNLCSTSTDKPFQSTVEKFRKKESFRKNLFSLIGLFLLVPTNKSRYECPIIANCCFSRYHMIKSIKQTKRKKI